jgi:hypothetical protein
MVLRPQPRRAMAAGMPHLLEHIAFLAFVRQSVRRKCGACSSLPVPSATHRPKAG